MREERILRKMRSRDPVGLQDLMDCYNTGTITVREL